MDGQEPTMWAMILDASINHILKQRSYMYHYLYLQNVSDKLASANIEMFIPAMHCYGHGSSCLRLYHPKRNAGLGHVDGEATERLWSHTGPYHTITKEMSPFKRLEQLEDVIRDVRLGKRYVLAPQILRKHNAIENTIKALHNTFLLYNTTSREARLLWKAERDSFEVVRIADINTEPELRLHIQSKILESAFFQRDIHSRSSPGESQCIFYYTRRYKHKPSSFQENSKGDSTH